MITTSHLYPVAGRCHSHSRTLSPALQITVPVAYTFRILAIGGIAFNLALAARPRETTNILFKHLTNTRCPGRARSAVCLGRNNSVASANNGETETPRPEKKRERDRAGDACFATICAPKFVGLHTLGRSFASSRPLLRPSGSFFFPTLFFPPVFLSLRALCRPFFFSAAPCSVSDVVIARSSSHPRSPRASFNHCLSFTCVLYFPLVARWILFICVRYQTAARFLLFIERESPCLPIGLRPCVPSIRIAMLVAFHFARFAMKTSYHDHHHHHHQSPDA